MKQSKYILILLFVGIVSCKNATKNGTNASYEMPEIVESLEIESIVVNGNLENVERGENITLYKYYGNDIQPFTSTTVHLDGAFQFKLENVKAGFYYIMLENQNPIELIFSPLEKTIKVYSQNDKVIIESEEINAFNEFKSIVSRRDFSLDSTSNLLGSISRIDPDYYRKKDKMRLDVDLETIRYYQLFDAFYHKYPDSYTAQILMPLLRKTTRNDNKELMEKFDNHHAYYHHHYFKNINLNNSYLLTNPYFLREFKTYLNHFRGEFEKDYYQSSDIVLSQISNRENKEFLIDYMAYFYINEGYEELANYIAQTYLEGCEDDYIERLKSYNDFSVGLQIGQQYQDFILPNSVNLGIQLSNIVTENKLTILFVWKSTCEHCQKEIPVLKRTYELYKPLGLEVVGVSIDRNRNEWLQFLEKEKMPWINLCDFKGASSEALKPYGVRSTPTVYVIDKKGNIVVKNIEKNQLREFLELYLNRK